MSKRFFARNASRCGIVWISMPSVFIKTYGCQMNVRDSEQVARDLAGRGYELVETRGQRRRGPAQYLLGARHGRAKGDRQDADAGGAQKASSASGHRVSRLHGAEPGRVDPGGIARGRSRHRHAKISRNGALCGRAFFVSGRKFRRSSRRGSSMSRRRPARKIPSAIICSRRTRSPPSSRSCRAATCTAPSASSRARAARNARGPSRKSSPKSNRWCGRACKEVTLLGQIVNLYGRHEFPAVEGRSPFAQLLHAVCAVPGLERVRFTSPHPIGFKDDLVACFRELPKLCEHVHLPLQSGSDRILKAMHRAYTRDGISAPDRKTPRRATAHRLHDRHHRRLPRRDGGRFPRRPAIWCARSAFDNAFIFRYSPRRDTPAATMEDQLPEEVKMERNQILLRILDEIADRRVKEPARARGRNSGRGRKPDESRALPGPHAHQPPRPRSRPTNAGAANCCPCA